MITLMTFITHKNIWIFKTVWTIYSLLKLISRPIKCSLSKYFFTISLPMIIFLAKRTGRMATLLACYFLCYRPGKETSLKATAQVRKELTNCAIRVTKSIGQFLSSGIVGIFYIDDFVASCVRAIHVLSRKLCYLIIIFF